MKTHLAQQGVQFFFHRYLVNSKKFIQEKRRKFDNEEQLSLSNVDFQSSKTGLHRCRLVQIGEEDLEAWPSYLLKRVSYFAERKQRKGVNYQVYDQNIKKVNQIRTEYLCYQIMSKSHRAVKMIEMINQNTKKPEDQQFFYNFLGRKKQVGILNACFILQVCNDGNLEDRINSLRNPLTEGHIIIYCCQILQGLIQFKKKGILHRDLRPCNIFLHNDEVQFGDFDSAFIYKQSQCIDIKNGIDINATPQQIVQLAALSDQQLQSIGNIKLFDLQSKCDIYFFGMIIFKMIFKRNYEKKFEGTDIEYLIRQKINEGFSCPKLLEVMKLCLYTNVDKRIDLVNLYEQLKLIEREKYFANNQKQRTYLSEDPLNLFSYNSLESAQPQIMTEIQNSISNTFTLSFASVQYDFSSDFFSSALHRQTKIYADQVSRVHSKFYRKNQNKSLWSSNIDKRNQLDRFIHIMEDFVIQLSKRAYYYDYLFKVILKINTKNIAKKEQKQIVIFNKERLEKQLIIVLKFLFQMLSRTPFKIDKNYSERNLPYETRKLFLNKVKINNKFNFFQGRAKTFTITDYQTYKIINQFYNIEYDESDSDSFQTIYENVLYILANIDKRLSQFLSQSIIDLLRPYESSKRLKYSQLKETLFIMITLEKQKLGQIKKSNLILMRNLLQPLFHEIFALDIEEAQLFFDNYKAKHQKEMGEGKKKQNIQLSFNLLSVSKKHLDCLFAFMNPFSQNQQQERLKQTENDPQQSGLLKRPEEEKIQKKLTQKYHYQLLNDDNELQNGSECNGQHVEGFQEQKREQIQVKIYQQQRNEEQYDQLAQNQS